MNIKNKKIKTLSKQNNSPPKFNTALTKKYHSFIETKEKK